MKLIRYGSAGKEKPGVILPDGRWVDVSAFGEDYDETFFENNSLDDLEKWIQDRGEGLPEVPQETRLGSPIVRPSKIICIGLNYAKHAKESGMEIPEEPVIFFKSTSAIVGPNDDLVIPKNGSKGEREFQLERSGQWVKGKSADTFAPIGPFLATRNEIKDPHNLHLWLKVNGDMMQEGDTSDFIFSVPEIVSYVSQFMSLLPGDIISTGTPPGVGLGMDPPRFLQAGDVVELGIGGLGESRQFVRSYEEASST